MSRMFPWETWPTLIGYFCLIVSDLTMASIHTVSSTCGHEFFLPPLQHADSSSLVGWVEIVACRDQHQPAVVVAVTMCTVSNDVVHTLSLSSNETAKLRLASLIGKDDSIRKQGLRLSISEKASVYAHLSNGNDVMTVLPFDAITSTYLIPDLRTSDFEEQRVFFFNIYSRTNVTVTSYFYTDSDNSWPGNEVEETGGKESSEKISDGEFNRMENTSVVSNETSSKLRTGSNLDDSASVSSSSTTAIKATPTLVNSRGNNSGNSNNVYNVRNNVTHSVFYLSSQMQTRSLGLESDSAVFLQANKPLGVVVVLSLSSSYSSSPSSLETSSPSWSSDDVTRTGCRGCADGDGEGVVVGGGEGEEETMTMEMVMPLSTLGRHFYLPLMSSFTNVKLIVSGQENATVEVHWDPNNTTNTSRHTIISNQSLRLEQPIKNIPFSSHVWMVSSSPVLVYAVIEICVAGPEKSDATADPQCYINAFFLPAIDQYFRCAVDVTDNTCSTLCPSFWNSETCTVKENVAASSDSSGSVVYSSSISDNRTWQVRHTVNGTSVNITDACVVANASYLPFRLDMASGTFFPAGTRLAKLYSACVPNISAQGGEGDGIDNDCDGLIDEEIENMKDDDGDDRIDEDTSSDCESDVSSRTARSGDLQRAVAAGPPWFIDYEEEDSEMPLLAVIISLSVAIFAVIAVISIFLLMELMSRRRQIRNTKIRPFVS